MCTYIESVSIAYPNLWRLYNAESTRDQLTHEAAIAAHLGVMTTVMSVASAIFAAIAINPFILTPLSLFFFVFGHDFCNTAKNLVGFLESNPNLRGAFRLANMDPQGVIAKINQFISGINQNNWLPWEAAPVMHYRVVAQCILAENNLALPR